MSKIVCRVKYKVLQIPSNLFAPEDASPMKNLVYKVSVPAMKFERAPPESGDPPIPALASRGASFLYISLNHHIIIASEKRTKLEDILEKLFHRPSRMPQNKTLAMLRNLILNTAQLLMRAVLNSGRAEHSCGEKTRDRIQSKREILNQNDFSF